MPVKQDPATMLAENMIRVLEEQRQLGPENYPVSVRRLAELTDPVASADLLSKAVAKRKPFGVRVSVVRAKDLDSPIAFVEDLRQLASSTQTLEFLLTSLCNPSTPTCDIARLKRSLPTKLKEPFQTSLVRRVEAGDLPPGVSVRVEKKKILLYLDRYPPPPPPRPPAEVLAEDLVKMLEARRRSGSQSYPLNLAELVESTRPGVTATLLKKALGASVFKDRVVVAIPKMKIPEQPGSPVALVEDRELLADWPPLLERTVRLARSDDVHALSQANLAKHVAPSLVESFSAALTRRLQSGTLPPTLGSLKQKKYLVFLLTDVRGGHAGTLPGAIATRLEAAAGNASGSSIKLDFVRAFDEAFERLDRQRGHNFVSLVELRSAVEADRLTFDSGLNSLRRAGRYTLSAEEGRDGISPEASAAGIREDGSLLLYVSRRLP